MERVAAHRILTEHAPERDPRWLWLRDRCATCRQRYPCPLRRSALAELTAGIPERLAPPPGWTQLLPRFWPANRGRW